MTATVTKIVKIVKHTNYSGYYVDNAGNYVTAEIVPNKWFVNLDDELEGYIVPKEPHKVYCYPSGWLILLLKGLGVLILAVGILAFILLVKNDLDTKKNKNNSISY